MLCLPELRGLERTLIKTADGNPRRMIRLCDFMLQAHLERPLKQSPEEIGEIAYLFSRADWEEAKRRIEHVAPSAAELETPENQTQSPTKSTKDGDVRTVKKPLVLGDTPKSPEDTRQHLEDYPAPIALLYLDYLNRQGPFERMSRMLDLFEATAAFVAVILLGQLRAFAGGNTAERLKSTGLRLRRTSLGTWLTIWQRLPGLCNTLGNSRQARRLQSIFSRYYDDLDSLRILRNKTRGHGATGSEQDAIEILKDYGPRVEDIIKSLGYLTSTCLIKVKHMEMHDDLFEHQARIFQGSNPNFPWDRFKLAHPLESDKLLLMQNDNNLALYPFITAEFCHDCRQEEIFTYQQVKGQEVQYLSYHTGHRFVSSNYLDDVKSIAGL
ncbi:hypothetical protein GF348_18205 [candidate division KSB3 bacterium]|nr:hypothetical protein [candidate division KSB3 bacterium]